jgi:hypothetical protein
MYVLSESRVTNQEPRAQQTKEDLSGLTARSRSSRLSKCPSLHKPRQDFMRILLPHIHIGRGSKYPRRSLVVIRIRFGRIIELR